MGEKQNRPFHFSSNSSLKVDFQGSRITSDAGLLLVREFDERLGLGQLISDNLTDHRRGKNTQLPLPDLLRQSIYSRLAGYEDLNDAERLSSDPTFRLIGSEKIRDRGAALPSRLHWFETQVLTQTANLSGLAAMNRELIAKAEGQERTWRAVLDMDSTEIPVYGEQEQSAYNTHYSSTCYHPLLLFNSGGDCVAAKLRPGNVHSADGWKELLLPEVERLQKLGKEVCFGLTRPLPSPTSTKHWKRVGRSTRFGFLPMTACCGTLQSCSRGLWAVRDISPLCGTRVFSIGRPVGRWHGG
jgi:hypothetical protein